MTSMCQIITHILKLTDKRNYYLKNNNKEKTRNKLAAIAFTHFIFRSKMTTNSGEKLNIEIFFNNKKQHYYAK